MCAEIHHQPNTPLHSLVARQQKRIFSAATAEEAKGGVRRVIPPVFPRWSLASAKRERSSIRQYRVLESIVLTVTEVQRIDQKGNRT